MTMTSVPEWDRQVRLVRVHHEHREQLGRLRLAAIGAGAVAVAGALGEALEPGFYLPAVALALSLSAEVADALALQRSLPDDMLKIVAEDEEGLSPLEDA